MVSHGTIDSIFTYTWMVIWFSWYINVGKYTIVPWILWFVESCFIKSMNKFLLEKLRVFCWHLCFVRIKRMELKTKPMILPRFWKKDNTRIGTRETKNKSRGSSCCCSTSLLYLDLGQKVYIFPLQNLQWKRESRLPSDLFMVFLVGMILGVYEVYMLLV